MPVSFILSIWISQWCICYSFYRDHCEVSHRYPVHRLKDFKWNETCLLTNSARLPLWATETWRVGHLTPSYWTVLAHSGINTPSHSEVTISFRSASLSSLSTFTFLNLNLSYRSFRILILISMLFPMTPFVLLYIMNFSLSFSLPPLQPPTFPLIPVPTMCLWAEIFYQVEASVKLIILISFQ